MYCILCFTYEYHISGFSFIIVDVHHVVAPNVRVIKDVEIGFLKESSLCCFLKGNFR